MLCKTHKNDDNCHVLFVEDNEIAQNVGLKLLKQAGFEPVLALTGEEAVEFAKDRTYHFILMDIGLPGIDGCEATQAIRKCPLNQETPIFAITAHYDCESSKVVCQQSGINKVFSKPLTTRKFLAIIDFMLERNYCG